MFSSKLITSDKNSPSKWFTKFLIWYLKLLWNYLKSLKLCITHKRWLFCTFLFETLFDFDKTSPSKYHISDFRFHQICTLMGSFCWKCIKYQLKKYRGVISHDTEEWCKIWRKTDLLIQNDKNLMNVDLSTRTVSKGCTWLVPLMQSI